MKYLIISITAVIVSVIMCSTREKHYRNEITELQSQIQFYHSIDTLEEHFLQIKTQTDGTFINKKTLNSIRKLNDGNLFFIFLSGNSNCSFCIEQSIELLKENITKIGCRNIILLSQFSNTRALNVLCSDYQLDSITTLNIKNGELNLSIENISRPSFFLLDKEGKISNTFIIEKKLVSRTEKYIESIVRNLEFKKNKLWEKYYLKI